MVSTLVPFILVYYLFLIPIVHYMYHFFECCRAIKNAKGVHSKKDPTPHRVAEISNVCLYNAVILLYCRPFLGSSKGKAVSTISAKSWKNCGIS